MESVRPSPLEPGYRIDRYELLYVHAQGGMGTVWVARLQGKHGFEKLYAVKTMLPKYAEDEAFRTMFLDEARIASAIDHPNIAQILDLGEHHGILYQVLEYVEGESIQRLLRIAEKTGEVVPIGIAMRLVADTCAGLHAAHELLDEGRRPREVVHRDVNPHNVLVSVGGVAKLIDFGIAKARDRLAGETSEGVLKGKIRYLSPEQAFGQQVDRRADIWSAAAMLRVMVDGGPPFSGESDMEVLRKLLSGAPPAPLPLDIPSPVAHVIERGLKCNRDERYATALEMQEAIDCALTEMATSCSPAAVGAWVRRLTASRIEGRREALDLALRAAEQRARVREVLERPLTNNSLHGTSSQVMAPRPAAIEVDIMPVTDAPRPSAPAETVITRPQGVPRKGRRRVLAGVTLGSMTLVGLTALFVNWAGSRRALAPSPAAAATAPAQSTQVLPIVPPSTLEPPPRAANAHTHSASESGDPSRPVEAAASPSANEAATASQTKGAAPRSRANSHISNASTSAAARPRADDLGGTIDSRK